MNAEGPLKLSKENSGRRPFPSRTFDCRDRLMGTHDPVLTSKRGPLGTRMTLLFTAKMLQPVFLRGETVYLSVSLSNPALRSVRLTESSGSCSITVTTPSSHS